MEQKQKQTFLKNVAVVPDSTDEIFSPESLAQEINESVIWSLRKVHLQEKRKRVTEFLVELDRSKANTNNRIDRYRSLICLHRCDYDTRVTKIALNALSEQQARTHSHAAKCGCATSWKYWSKEREYFASAIRSHGKDFRKIRDEISKSMHNIASSGRLGSTILENSSQKYREPCSITIADVITYYYTVFKQSKEYESFSRKKKRKKRDIDKHDERCFWCHNYGTLILCDGVGCTRASHLECCRPALKEFPEGEWYCTHCRMKMLNREESW